MNPKRPVFWYLPLFLLAAGCVGCDSGDSSSRSGSDVEQTGKYDLIPLLADFTWVDGAVGPGHAACRHLVGEDWYSAERNPNSGAYAWTRGPRATLHLPLSRSGAGRILVRGYGLDDGQGPRHLRVFVNGHDLGRELLPNRTVDMIFAVGEGLLEAGLNELVLETERAIRPVALNRGQD
ncbi:MAG: hypothetical protein ABIF77_03640, partial [bacterium]